MQLGLSNHHEAIVDLQRQRSLCTLISEKRCPSLQASPAQSCRSHLLQKTQAQTCCMLNPTLSRRCHSPRCPAKPDLKEPHSDVHR